MNSKIIDIIAEAEQLMNKAAALSATADEMLRRVIIDALERSDLSEMEMLLEKLPVDHRSELRTAIVQKKFTGHRR